MYIWKWHSENSTSTSLDASDRIEESTKIDHKLKHMCIYFTVNLPLIDTHPINTAPTNRTTARIWKGFSMLSYSNTHCLPFPIFNFFFAPFPPSGHIHTAHGRFSARHAYIICMKAKQRNTPKKIEPMFTRRHCHTSAMRSTNSKIVSAATSGFYLSLFFIFEMICLSSPVSLVGGRVSFVSPALSDVTSLYVE